MLEILVASILSSLVIIAYGNFFCKLIFSSYYLSTISNSEKSLLGIIFLTFVAVLINFFAPLNKEICSFVFLIGLYLSIKNKVYSDYFYIIIVSTLTLGLVLYSNINRPDGGLYHIPIINIINENKIILGSVNIHFRFAHGSIIQNFSALYNIYYFNISFITISIASIFSFFLYFIYDKINYYIKKKNKILSLVNIITFVFSIYSFNRYSSYGNDAVANIYFIYLILSLLSVNLKNVISNDFFIKISLISFFLAGLKLFMILNLIIPFFLFFRLNNKIKLFKNSATYICIIFISSIFLKSLLISGCALYPIENTCIKSFKIYNEQQLQDTAYVSEAWSKGWPDQKGEFKNFKDFNKNFNWLKIWKENHLIYILKKITPFLVIIFLLIIFIIFQDIKSKVRSEVVLDKSSLFFIFFFSLTCCLLWFLKFPLYRFGLSFLYSLILLTFVIFMQNKINSLEIKKIRFLAFICIFLSMTGFSIKNLDRILNNINLNNSSIWPKIIATDKFEKIYVSKNGFYYFSNGKQCMYGSAPCTYYKTENIRSRNFLNYKIFWVKN